MSFEPQNLPRKSSNDLITLQSRSGEEESYERRSARAETNNAGWTGSSMTFRVVSSRENSLSLPPCVVTYRIRRAKRPTDKAMKSYNSLFNGS